MLITGAALAIVALLMLVELRVSQSNERWLLDHGAIEPHDSAYRAMTFAYPGTFIAMAVESALFGGASDRVAIAGAIVFVLAKVLKVWAIASLGRLWTYRILVVPSAPLVRHGPYRWLRHPNYVGVVGELAGMALMVGARVTGPIAIVYFAYLLQIRIRDEERALYQG